MHGADCITIMQCHATCCDHLSLQLPTNTVYATYQSSHMHIPMLARPDV